MIEPKDHKDTKSQSKFFYGYVIVIAGCCIMMAYMAARAAFGVFFKPMADEFGWSSAALSSTYTVSTVLEGLFGIAAGRLADRFGPRKVLLFFGSFMGLGYILMSLVNDLWQMYLIYGVLIGISTGGIFVPLVSSVVRWFITRRNLMSGIVGTGMGLGVLIGSPLANWLIYSFHWRTAYIVIGIIVLIIVVLSSLFLKRDPAQMGLTPYYKQSSREPMIKHNVDSLSFQNAFHTRQYWLLFGMLFCFGFCGISLHVYVVPHAINIGISPVNAANILATIGIGSIFGRLAINSFTDRIGNKKAFIFGFGLLIAALFSLLFIKELWIFYLVAFIHGFNTGAATSLYAPIVAEYFGLKSHGTVFGAIGFGSMIGSAFGPFVAGYIFDVNGSYHSAFLIFTAFSLVGLAIVWLLTPVRIKAKV